ncbi:MAG: pyridoxamine kinase [Clostridia bacterium]
MTTKCKRLLTIQDISCLGKCSLTVALPIVSALGVECAVIPSAVLSTHTGNFDNYTFKDLTAELEPIVAHWDSYDIVFDALYTGYIASADQLCIIKNIFEHYKMKESCNIVDPVLGDYGTIYRGFDKNFVDKMRELCNVADIIIPNVTEACALLEIPFCGAELDKLSTDKLLRSLGKICNGTIVLTGVSFESGKIGVGILNVKTDKIDYCFAPKIGTNFHGTGDIFASVVAGCIVKGCDIIKASQVAVDFVSECIKNTVNNCNKRWYGVNFEETLNMLTNLK